MTIFTDAEKSLTAIFKQLVEIRAFFEKREKDQDCLFEESYREFHLKHYETKKEISQGLSNIDDKISELIQKINNLEILLNVNIKSFKSKNKEIESNKRDIMALNAFTKIYSQENK